MSSMEDIHPEDDRHHTKPTRGTLGKLSNTLNNLRESSAYDQENTVWTARTDYAYDIRLLFKRRITNLYISFTNLRSYVEINYSGFRKIVKKYVFNMPCYAPSSLSSHSWAAHGLASESLLTTAST